MATTPNIEKQCESAKRLTEAVAAASERTGLPLRLYTWVENPLQRQADDTIAEYGEADARVYYQVWDMQLVRPVPNPLALLACVEIQPPGAGGE